MSSKIKTPIGEKSWVSHLDKNENVEYIITSKENDRSFYFLYNVDKNGKLNKLSKNKNPNSFVELIKI